MITKTRIAIINSDTVLISCQYLVVAMILIFVSLVFNEGGDFISN